MVKSKGRRYEYRRDGAGFPLPYDPAPAKLFGMTNEANRGTFHPVDLTDAKIRERHFENQTDKWLNEQVKRSERNELSPGTLKDYKAYVKRFNDIFSGKDVRTIKDEDLVNFLDTLSDLSIKSRKNIFN